MDEIEGLKEHVFHEPVHEHVADPVVEEPKDMTNLKDVANLDDVAILDDMKDVSSVEEPQQPGKCSPILLKLRKIQAGIEFSRKRRLV